MSSFTGFHFRGVAAGAHHTVAVTAEGYVYAWGKGSDGQLGLGTRIHHTSPRLIPGLGGADSPQQGQCCGGDGRHGLADMGMVVDVACGAFHSCALTSRGTVFVWGLRPGFSCVLVSVLPPASFRFPSRTKKLAVRMLR